MNKNFLYASATLIGTIVGAGMFGLPYVVAQSGFLIGAVFLLVLTGVTLLIHLIYGEIVCRTTEKHRLVGYAEHYLGKWGKRIATFSILIGFYGSLLVYLIISGEFLSTIFSPLFGGSPFIYSLVFVAIGAFAVFKDVVLIKKIELGMSFFMILIIFLIFFSGLPHLDVSNFKNIDLKYFFLPYGVVFWALAGGAAIPEIREILETDGKKYKNTIILGTIIPAILYFLFLLTVVGISGQATSPEAIKGLVGFLGEGIVIVGAVLGLLAVITSYLVIGLYLKKVFWYDYKINKNLSWFLVCLIPLAGFLLGLRAFIPLMSFLGVILGAIEGTVLVLTYIKAKKSGDREPEYGLKIPNIVIYSLIALFILGFIYEIIYFVK
jgi:tyrosine-specific transport protein